MTIIPNRMVYCPYSDREIPESESSPEHIIPLSLGGVNGLEIPVDATVNSTLGSEIDGKLATEFLWEQRRTEYDARGHSGKEPRATIKKASYGENSRLAQVDFSHKSGVRVWDVHDRKFKKGSGPIQISTPLNIDLPTRFAAKVALAAGYYVYGDLFRQYVDHRQLRDVMNIDPAKLDLSKEPTELGLDHLTVRTDDYLHEVPSDPDSEILILRFFCSWVKGSVVVLIPGQGCLCVGVGLLGDYLAMVNVPARTELFPNKGACAWGHVMAITDKKLKRYSWMDGLQRWVNASKQTKGGR